MSDITAKYLFRCIIVVHKNNVTAINTALQNRGYGPTNFTIQVAKESAPTVLIGYISGWACTYLQLRDLKLLVDTYKLTEVVLWPRVNTRAVPKRMKNRIIEEFDKPEYQDSNPATRIKGRVTLRTNSITESQVLNFLNLVRI